MIYLTDVAVGNNPATHLNSTSRHVTEIAELIANGTVHGGMIPKVRACVNAVKSGTASAHLLDGRVPHVLLLELFTDAGIGTMVTNGHDSTTHKEQVSNKA